MDLQFDFTTEALDYILSQVPADFYDHYRVLVDYVDGNSPFNEEPVACHANVIGKYRLLVVPQGHPAVDFDRYDVRLDSNLAPLYLNSHYRLMFDHHHRVGFDIGYPALTLTSDAGIITPKMPLLVITS